MATSPKRTTMADVARAAGTSTAVVSYVLNPGTRPVSDALRERVLVAVAELDYRPDRHARALRRRRGWRQIGVVVPDATLPLYGALVATLERQGRARGQLMITGSTGFVPAVELELVHGLLEAGVDGLVCATPADARAVDRLCAGARVPLVWLHNAEGHPGHALVGSDHVAAGRLATAHLHEHHGRRRVAFVGGFTRADAPFGDRDAVRDRHRGYAEVLGLGAEQIRTDLTLGGAYTALARRLAAADPPDGLVIGTFGQSAAVLRAALDAGLRVPEDLAIVTFDADPRNTYEPITLAAVQQQVDRIAQQAVELLTGAAETAEHDATETGEPGELPAGACGPGPGPQAPPLLGVIFRPGESCGCGQPPT
ncbi:MAG TPA: LacI family DNA-binding transcriptional regulator [Solirubrobacteraceae bacterium]|nr:LacI family DNA-binding transcriptional regulator [Solirubrobacteraceae bacterium]